MSKVYVGDTGTLIELETGSDLTGATVLQIKARKPDGTTVVTWTATASGTKLRYTTLSNDLDTAGVWQLHASVTLPSGHWTGEGAKLRVYALYS